MSGIRTCPQHGSYATACGCTAEQMDATLRQAFSRPLPLTRRQQLKELERVDKLVLKAWQKLFALSKVSDSSALLEMLAGLEAVQSSSAKIVRQ